MSASVLRVKGQMREQSGYCWQKAEEYAARAAEAPDKETRELFIRFRNSWLTAAKRYAAPHTASPSKRLPSWPSPSTPELGTHEWSRRSTGGLTAPAERLGGA